VRSYTTKPERLSEISPESQPSNTITRFSFYFSSFFPPPRLNIISLFKKLVKQVFKIAWNYPRGQKRVPHDPSSPFKEKEKGGEGGSKAWWPMEGFKAWWPMKGSKAWWPWKDLKLGGQWKDPKLGGHGRIQSLVANGRFQAWWPMEGSKLGGHWNVPSLMAIGMWRINTFSLLPFSPNNFTYTLNFPFDLMILLYHGPKLLLPPFFSLLRTINYDCAPQRNKSFPPPLSNWFRLKI